MQANVDAPVATIYEDDLEDAKAEPDGKGLRGYILNLNADLQQNQ